MAHAYTGKGYNKEITTQKRPFLANLITVAIMLFVLYAVISLASEWRKGSVNHFVLNLSISRLPYYALLSTGRMAIAYVISLVFSLLIIHFYP